VHGSPDSSSRRSGRVTIKDVAQVSGVSTATVTRALQGSPRVLPATRQRVEEVAAKLGYFPDNVARALATGSSKTIGLVIPSSGDSFWGEVTEGLEERAAERGFTLLLGISHADPERERKVLGLFLEKRVEGIVIAGPAGALDSWFEAGASRQPIVLVSWDAASSPEEFELALRRPVTETIGTAAATVLAGPWVAHVGVDDLAGSAELVRYLVSLGHERIGLIAGPPLRSALLRLLGFRLGLEEAGLETGPIVACEESFEAGNLAAAELLQMPRPPTAIVAYNDIIAIGAMRGARSLGMDVPGDVSIIGFDDIEFASYVEPPLTTSRQPKREMGRLAIDLLLDAVDGRTGPVRATLPAELVVRESTGPR
jgi:LacI family repressor for deo operon, udp, cdd, tsx, nupC, and nupG